MPTRKELHNRVKKCVSEQRGNMESHIMKLAWLSVRTNNIQPMLQRIEFHAWRLAKKKKDK